MEVPRLKNRHDVVGMYQDGTPWQSLHVFIEYGVLKAYVWTTDEGFEEALEACKAAGWFISFDSPDKFSAKGTREGFGSDLTVTRRTPGSNTQKEGDTCKQQTR